MEGSSKLLLHCDACYTPRCMESQSSHASTAQHAMWVRLQIMLGCMRAGITAGMNKDKQTVGLGIWKHPRLTRALFDTYMGPRPVDLAGKLQVGQGILYVTNGFKCVTPAPHADEQSTAAHGMHMRTEHADGV